MSPGGLNGFLLLHKMTRCVMSFSKGLTTWVMRLGPTAMIWRWNMTRREAMRTLRATSFGRHGYLAAGPLIVAW
jgi:hypothetical protein